MKSDTPPASNAPEPLPWMVEAVKELGSVWAILRHQETRSLAIAIISKHAPPQQAQAHGGREALDSFFCLVERMREDDGAPDWAEEDYKKYKAALAAHALKWLFGLALTALIIWVLAQDAHAEGLAEIRSRCITREVVSAGVSTTAALLWTAKGDHNHDIRFAGFTHSMEPNLTDWDCMLVERVKPGESLVVGAIYLYAASWYKGDEIVHQLVRLSGDKALFWGTGNKRSDPWTDIANVHWRVVRILGTRKTAYAGGMNP